MPANNRKHTYATLSRELKWMGLIWAILGIFLGLFGFIRESQGDKMFWVGCGVACLALTLDMILEGKTPWWKIVGWLIMTFGTLYFLIEHRVSVICRFFTAFCGEDGF